MLTTDTMLTSRFSFVFAFAFAGLLASCGAESNGTTSSSSSNSGLYGAGTSAPEASKPKPPPPPVTGPEVLVEIETPFGTMTAKLYNETPLHRANFLKLAEAGFYDDLLFHRVIRGFMVQGGDPESKGAPTGKALGSGGPGYTVPAEIDPRFIHKKGALSAARLGDGANPAKASSGSQFYVVQGSVQTEQSLASSDAQNGYSGDQREIYYATGGTPFLDGQYTVFGEVIEGLDIIDKIAAVKTAAGDRPVEDVWMKVRVVAD